MARQLKELQSQVCAKLPQSEPDARELGNFLDACGGVVGKAAHMYCKSRQWRSEEAVDGILDEEGGHEREERVRRFQQYVDGLTDREGRPVAVWRAGRVPVRAMMEEVGAAAVLRNHVYLKERSLLRAHEAGHSSHILVLDMAGMGMAQMDREGLAALHRGIEIEQRYYPETLHKIVIIRAPWIFSAAWNIVSPWLSENDRAKIEISAEESGAAALAPVMEHSQIPDFLGGAKDCPVAGSQASTPAASAGELEIAAGQKHEVLLPLDAPGTAVSWCWSTEAHDLACSILFVRVRFQIIGNA